MRTLAIKHRDTSPDSTPTQQLVLDAISRLTVERGFPPTVRELAIAVGLKSSSSIWMRLAALRRKGFIEWDNRSPRTRSEL